MQFRTETFRARDDADARRKIVAFVCKGGIPVPQGTWLTAPDVIAVDGILTVHPKVFNCRDSETGRQIALPWRELHAIPGYVWAGAGVKWNIP